MMCSGSPKRVSLMTGRVDDLVRLGIYPWRFAKRSGILL